MKLLNLSSNHCTLAYLILALLQKYYFCQVIDNNNNIENNAPVFHTKSGPVRGTLIKTENNQDVNVFYGIPYSESPTGQLRFQPPKKIQPWTSVLEANKPKPICYQQFPTGRTKLDTVRLYALRPWTEDCLHLNIWAPSGHTENLPVVFFIHGGNFIMGTGSRAIDGTTMVSDGFVVVSINFRLSAFGFFSLGTEEAPGNLGLMDQNLALHWVKENIEVFGGDPEEITLLGFSSGSASAGFHLLSPKSNGLFKRAVLMSGVPTNWWSMKDRQHILTKSQELLATLGCKSENSSASLQCLQQKHPEDIIDLCRTETFDTEKDFGPFVDGKFITEDPSISVDSGRFNKADVMLGTVIDEGVTFMVMRNEDILKTEDGRLHRRDFSEVIRKSHPSLSNIQALALDVVYVNASSPNDPIMLRNVAKDVYSDAWFNCRIDEFAEKLAETGNSVYRYVFNYKLGRPNKWSPRWAGAVHANDLLPLLFPAPVLKQLATSDKTIEDCKRFRKRIEDFARSGDPNLDQEKFPDEPVWPKFDGQKLALYFANTSTVLPVQRQRECAAWLNLIPLLDRTSC